jgi:hypothetical protein
MRKAVTLIKILLVHGNKKMLKKLSLALVMGAISSVVSAKNHQVISLPDAFNAASNKQVSVVAKNSQNMVLTFTREGVLHVQPFSNGSRGMNPLSEVLLSADELQPDTSHNNVVLLGAEADIYGHYQLVKTARCDETSCSEPTYALTVHDASGKLDKNRINNGYEVLPHDCVNEPSIYPAPEGVWVDTGCGEATLHSPLLQTTDVKFAIPSILMGQDFKVYHTPFYDWPSTDQERVRQNGGLVFVGAYEGNAVHRLSFNEIGELLTSNIVIEGGDCFPLSGVKVTVGCRVENSVQLYSLDGSNKGLYSKARRITESADDELYFDPVQSGFTWGEQVFLTQASRLSNLVEDGEEQVQKIDEQWRITAYRQIDQKHTVVSISDIAADDIVQGAPEFGAYKMSPDSFYAVALVKIGNTTVFSFYDQLNVDAAPRFLSGVGGVMPSNQTLTQPLLFEDQETPYESILFSTPGLADWFVVREDESPYEITASPYHDNLGEEVVTFSLIDNGGNDFDFEAPFTVELSDYQTLVFEPLLYERLELDEAVPLTSLLNSLKRIPLIEDEVYNFDFSWFNRLSPEVSITWRNLPKWLVWDEESDRLTVSPEQQDVGNTDDVFMLIDDRFSPVDSDTGTRTLREINVRISVQEVNEQFDFVGTGEAEIAVGQLYTYTVNINDEETLVGDMELSVNVSPDWMTWSPSTRTLSGVPAIGDVGIHRVQVTAREPGAYVSVQTFNVTVIGVEPVIESSGGSIGMWSLLLGLAVALRRRRA